MAAFACSPRGNGGDAETGDNDTTRGDLAVTGRGESGAAADAKPSPDEYVVYVEKLNLRGKAGTEGDVVALLTRGDPVTYVKGDVWIAETAGSPSDPWFNVETNGGKGWVAGRCVVSRELYEDYRRADELGRAGKADEMLEELANVTIAREVPGSPPESNVHVSPDHRKAVCWAGFSEGEGDEVVVCPHLYFEAGKGLADAFYDLTPESWSDDSRYLHFSTTVKPVFYDTGSGRLMYGEN